MNSLLLLPLWVFFIGDGITFSIALHRALRADHWQEWVGRGWKRFIPGSGYYLIAQYPSNDQL